jgi:hypothetical protein
LFKTGESFGTDIEVKESGEIKIYFCLLPHKGTFLTHSATKKANQEEVTCARSA